MVILGKYKRTVHEENILKFTNRSFIDIYRDYTNQQLKLQICQERLEALERLLKVQKNNQIISSRVIPKFQKEIEKNDTFEGK